MLNYFMVFLFRLVKTQVEVEMEVETPDEGNNEERIVSIEEEEEVVLMWNNSEKNKGIRELAMGIMDNIKDEKEDREVLEYYRSVYAYLALQGKAIA